MTKTRHAEAKPLSFSTTMRNPMRISSFLNQILPYENSILTNNIIDKVVHNVIKNKLYKPYYIDRNPMLFSIYKNEDLEFSNEQINEIVVNSPQDHKERGFDKGWPSRFDTWYKLPKEFGFVYYEIGKPIQISQIGHMLIDALNESPSNEQKIQNVFLNAMMKYQSSNPFRKNSNANVPLLLLLNVIKLLKNDTEENGAGVYRQELSLFICWKDNDAYALYKKIKQIRKEYGYTYSDEYMYDLCLELLGATTLEEKQKMKKRYKMPKICGEAVDEYIRKMRSTGIISLRGNGRFLDFDSFEQEKIDYVLEHYSTYNKFFDKKKYYDYMGEIDNKILSMEKENTTEENAIRLKTLKEFAQRYTPEEILHELSLLIGKRQESLNPVFRILTAPTRLEFLTSIALVQQFDDLIVMPNYCIDDEGLPKTTAVRDVPDIVCSDPETDSLIEVTLMCGKDDQISREVIPGRRHLLDRLEIRDKVFSVIIAPTIHEDTKQMALWYKNKDNLDIMTYTISEFIELAKNSSKINQLLQN